MTDPNETVRAIIARALSDLIAVGMDEEGASALLAVQGVIRLESCQHLQTVIDLARDSLEAFREPERLH